MSEIAMELRSIKEAQTARDNLDKQRREVDDARELRAQKDRDELLERVNRHGIRMTGMETMWAAFFGEQGAFKGFVGKLEQHDKKLDRLLWLGAAGTGILIAVQFFMKR